jgi:Arc/MetJ family transcription regulator
MLDGRLRRADIKQLALRGNSVYNNIRIYTLEAFMRTNIVIDDSLMNQALIISGYKTKKETVEEGLKLLIAQRNQSKIRNLRGKLNWEGDLDQMRTDK